MKEKWSIAPCCEKNIKNRHNMKKNTTLRNGIIALVVSCMVFSACKEDIDTSNRYTFLGETVGSFLEKNAET